MLVEGDKVIVYGKPGPAGELVWRGIILKREYVVDGTKFVRIQADINNLIYLVHEKQIEEVVL